MGHPGEDEPLTLGEAFDDGEDDPGVAPPRTRVRLLVTLSVVGGVVALVLGVLGVVALIHSVGGRDRVDATTIVARHQREFRTCVGGDVAPARCADTAFQSCLADPDWRGTASATVADRCRAVRR